MKKLISTVCALVVTSSAMAQEKEASDPESRAAKLEKSIKKMSDAKASYEKAAANFKKVTSKITDETKRKAVTEAFQKRKKLIDEACKLEMQLNVEIFRLPNTSTPSSWLYHSSRAAALKRETEVIESLTRLVLQEWSAE